MIDSVTIASNVIQENYSMGIELIDKVDSFYNNAWYKLVLFGSILFAMVGIFVPLVIQWFQKRTLKLSEQSLRQNLKKEITEELLTEIEKKFEANEAIIKSLNASANSKIMFSQAKFSLEKNSYKGALGELVIASYSSIECEDFKTLQEMLDALLIGCLPNLSLEEIEDLKTANVCDLSKFLDHLHSHDDRAMFQTKIGEIRVLMTKLPKSFAEKPSEKSKT